MLKENVLYHMQQRNWSQRDLSKASGVDESSISKIVNGKRKEPEYETLSKLSSTLGISIEALMSEQPATNS